MSLVLLLKRKASEIISKRQATEDLSHLKFIQFIHSLQILLVANIFHKKKLVISDIGLSLLNMNMSSLLSPENLVIVVVVSFDDMT